VDAACKQNAAQMQMEANEIDFHWFLPVMSTFRNRFGLTWSDGGKKNA
jgi:hypothetical protein